MRHSPKLRHNARAHTEHTIAPATDGPYLSAAEARGGVVKEIHARYA